MKNLKLVTLVFTLFSIVGFPAVSKAQQVATAQDLRVEKAAPKQLTGKVTQINPTDNTITLMVQDKALTFSADKLKGSPRVGSTIYLVEQQARYFFSTCEKCNAVCPGVCFLESSYCRCYLFHL